MTSEFITIFVVVCPKIDKIKTSDSFVMLVDEHSQSFSSQAGVEKTKRCLCETFVNVISTGALSRGSARVAPSWV